MNDAVIEISPNDPPTWFWAEYEVLDWSNLLLPSSKHIMNAYCIRKGLIRKAQLALNIQKYMSKFPDSTLAKHVPETYVLQVDHVDYLDEALNECFEVERDLLRNASLEVAQRKKFILKPSLANKGVGIHLIDDRQQLENILQGYQDQADAFYDRDDDEGMNPGFQGWHEWVVQAYMDRPLLLKEMGDRKFHIRAYMLLVGRCKAYLFTEMLALFAQDPYPQHQHSTDHLSAHLTNTCLLELTQDQDEEKYVRLLADVVTDPTRYTCWIDQMAEILQELMKATVSEVTTFQPRENAFELFGLDFVVDEEERLFFLEANAFPDFKQTGHTLGKVIQRLFDGSVDIARHELLGEGKVEDESMERFRLVYDYQKDSMSSHK